ncbi:MAG: type II toxin-antitoxin system HicA family toxin [Thermosynechococcaceae cyanobacterium MS004]|nr:type II toxin-antitoxin system HicA family toxin [Thermosynechococcaceae cyanobacterium MS004]
MVKSVRELKAMLLKAGFSEFSAKGSHTKWLHPLFLGRVILSGKDSNDAKPYQVREVMDAIKQIKDKELEE